jgi:RNA polymerase sigma-70 factor, ECF subfamily
MAGTDDELVRRAVQGDYDALSALLARYGLQIERQLQGMIARRWRSVLDIEDVMQVTYLEAFLEIERYPAGDACSFAGWLKRIAENNLRDAVRALQREKRPQPARRVGAPAYADSGVALIEVLGGSTTTAGGAAARHENQRLVETAIGQLPDDYATVVRLYDLEGLSGPEVAERTGRSRGAVHMLRSRAHAHLRRLLGSESKFFSNTP